MKKEVWNGHQIRFVEKDGEWWAVARDVAEALGFVESTGLVNANDMTKHLDTDEVSKARILCDTTNSPTTSRARKTQDVQIISESGIYHAIFHSRKSEAKAFRRWVCDIIKELRASLGLNEYEAFRLMDKEHQKEAMRRLNERLHEPVKVDYIKANTIADKAISTRYGFPKMLKKGAMSEAMLRDREPVLDDVVNLMALNERLNLGISISEVIYQRYGNKPAV
jgi:prophage antirepressor-like protein